MAAPKPRILFVDDDTNLLAGLRRALRAERSRWDMSFVDTPQAALTAVTEGQVDVLITDLAMPEMNGRQLIEQVNGFAPDIPCLVLSGTADLNSAVELINSVKPFRLLIKPQTAPDLVMAVEDALDHKAALAAPSPVLDSLHVGVVVAEPTGKVRTTNEAAAALLGDADIVSLDTGGYLRTNAQETTKSLYSKLSAACGDPAKGGAMTVEAVDGEARLQLHISPLDRGEESLAVVFLNNPDEAAPMTTERIAELLDLTRTESILVINLVRGLSLEECAEAQGVTMSSARTYLKRVFAKTGTKRQSDLIRLVLTGAVAR